MSSFFIAQSIPAAPEKQAMFPSFQPSPNFVWGREPACPVGRVESKPERFSLRTFSEKSTGEVSESHFE